MEGKLFQGIIPVKTKRFLTPFLPNLFGCERAWLEPSEEKARDIDVLFVGNLHPAVQRERLPWLGRLARLADHRRVAIRTGVFGAEYCDLLRRARIVFNRSIRGECNRRAFEAAAAGALLFQENGNLEVPAFFQDRQECVYYDEDNLEDLLEYYLDHEDERRGIAEAGRKKVANYSFEELWDGQVRAIERELIRRQGEEERGRQGDAETGRPAVGGFDGVRDPRRAREPGRATGGELLGRVWEVMNHGGGDAALANDVASALVREPRSGTLHNALGLVLAVAGHGAREVASYFARAVERDPEHIVARLNWVEALAASGQKQEAVEQAERALKLLEDGSSLVRGQRSEIRSQNEEKEAIRGDVLDNGHYPVQFDFFRVEWERAAWQNAGDPRAEAGAKADLLRWRLHALVAEMTGDLSQYHEAVLARPDLGCTQAALGCALGNGGHMGPAVTHLRRAVNDNPFDHQAAQALFQVLGAAGEGAAQRRLADQRRLLAKSAPKLVPMEPWMERVPPAGEEMASIIVLCCNQVEYTKLCLESVLRHTRPPYELVIVDNGSTDATASYLEELRRRREPARTVVIRNLSNLGFAAGCNQALEQARGRYLVFLNNDTVVTPGWLSNLVACALHDWPNVGLVGPVSNCAPCASACGGRVSGFVGHRSIRDPARPAIRG